MALSSPNIPVFYKVNRPLRFDDSTIGTETVTVSTTDAQSDTTLNNAKDLVFDYRGTSSLVSVNSMRSGFRMRFKFKTRGGNPIADLHDANITLSNNFWAHLFSDFHVKVGSSDVESIPNFGVVYDATCALSGESFKRHGSLAAYIPDEDRGDLDDPGYKKRKAHYNYPLQGADDAAMNPQYRRIEVFVPLRFMSGFCKTFNRLTTNLSYRFTLRRNGLTSDAVYGAVNTTMVLKMTSIQLELESHDPNAGLKAEYLGVVEKSKELDVAFTAYTSVLNAGVTSTNCKFSESQFSQARTLVVCAKNADTRDNAQSNYGVYTHADIRDILHEIQTRRYPYHQQEAEFQSNCYAAFYKDMIDSVLKDNGDCGLSSLDFKMLYPFMAIEVSAQEPAPNNKPLNIKTTIRRNSATPANVDMYLIIGFERNYKMDMKRDVMTQS